MPIVYCAARRKATDSAEAPELSSLPRKGGEAVGELPELHSVASTMAPKLPQITRLQFPQNSPQIFGA